MPRLLRAVARLTPLILCGCLDTSPTEPEGSVLSPGVFRSISGDANVPRRFTVTVPVNTGSVRFEIRDGGTGPVLLVRHGSPTELLGNDCESTLLSSVQECLIYQPAAGTWHVTVADDQAFEGVRVRAVFGSDTGAAPITSGAPVAALDGAEGSFRMYRIAVPAGHTLTATLAGGSGDADLFVRRALYPTINQYDCASVSESNAESCAVSHEAAQTWYVRVNAWNAYTGATLTASVTPPLP